MKKKYICEIYPFFIYIYTSIYNSLQGLFVIEKRLNEYFSQCFAKGKNSEHSLENIVSNMHIMYIIYICRGWKQEKEISYACESFLFFFLLLFFFYDLFSSPFFSSPLESIKFPSKKRKKEKKKEKVKKKRKRKRKKKNRQTGSERVFISDNSERKKNKVLSLKEPAHLYYP